MTWMISNERCSYRLHRANRVVGLAVLSLEVCASGAWLVGVEGEVHRAMRGGRSSRHRWASARLLDAVTLAPGLGALLHPLDPLALLTSLSLHRLEYGKRRRLAVTERGVVKLVEAVSLRDDEVEVRRAGGVLARLRFHPATFFPVEVELLRGATGRHVVAQEHSVFESASQRGVELAAHQLPHASNLRVG